MKLIDKDIKRTSSQVMELKDLISGPLAATIDADSIAARRYLSYLMELAFESYDKQTGKVGKLRMLEFNYKTQDVNGSSVQNVKIPLLTLVPLPLLQVKEADKKIFYANNQERCIWQGCRRTPAIAGCMWL